MRKKFAALAAALCLTVSCLTAPSGAASCYPRYTGGGGSIAAALYALGEDPSYASRERIAAANGIGNYRGTAAQNITMLELLKGGVLVRPDASGPSAGQVCGNLNRVSFLRQDRSTCKATSAAMAVNLILGRDENTTADMIYTGVLCRSLEGERYTGSDGNTYQAAYRTDRYVGSAGELTAEVEAALAAGLPIVAPVHSAATRHHWIVVVGRDSQGNYLAVDPAGSGWGTMASQARRMSELGYSFGLTDYAEPHYGYISFRRVG